MKCDKALASEASQNGSSLKEASLLARNVGLVEGVLERVVFYFYLNRRYA